MSPTSGSSCSSKDANPPALTGEIEHINPMSNSSQGSGAVPQSFPITSDSPYEEDHIADQKAMPSDDDSDSSGSDSDSDTSRYTCDDELDVTLQWQQAMRGLAIPASLQHEETRWATIRGIRCHYDFATDPDMEELCLRYPEFARARNARLIMSDEIPETGLENPEQRPYCIWHPHVADKSTYRELVARYPDMRYQVGRACAVAGYLNLYKDLNLLPDVCIAEEARESKTTAGNAIYKLIMSAPARYAVMDDAYRTINTEDPIMPAYLNGDTCVRRMLTVRAPVDAGWRRYKVNCDIEEDQRFGDSFNIDEEPSESQNDDMLSPEDTKLLYTPLPMDLPTVNRDLHILMAAYDGNIDRYARLKRRYTSNIERHCIIRGIYHHTMFARWWADQLEINAQEIEDSGAYVSEIQSAINARRIMINDLSGLSEGFKDQPDLIWWPLRPRPATLLQLAERCPAMKRQVAIACVKCDYEQLYKDLQPKPNSLLLEAARLSPNKFYQEDIEKRAKDWDSDDGPHWSGESECLRDDLEPTESFTFSYLHPRSMGCEAGNGGPYFGEHAEPGQVERYVWLSPILLQKFVERYGHDGWHGPLTEYWRDRRETDDEQEEKERIQNGTTQPSEGVFHPISYEHF